MGIAWDGEPAAFCGFCIQAPVNDDLNGRLKVVTLVRKPQESLASTAWALAHEAA